MNNCAAQHFIWKMYSLSKGDYNSVHPVHRPCNRSILYILYIKKDNWCIG